MSHCGKQVGNIIERALGVEPELPAALARALSLPKTFTYMDNSLDCLEELVAYL